MDSLMTKSVFDSPYSHSEIEEKWYQFWLKKGYFSADNRSGKKPYVIMMPPPNITGALHLGHALTSAIQDILIRWKRMQGLNTLWLPGSDHAGIATQNVVEKELQKEGLNRHEVGREKFVERVWEWQRKSGHTIMTQLRRFGSSCDWTRERFTMDEYLSAAVRQAFVSLYKEGLIYRGDYLINWCPRCESALSDLEVSHVDVKGTLWHIRYPFESGEGGVSVATTRPETMLGDVAVAVHPADERFRTFIGKMLNLPLLKRRIPLIAEETVDPSFGTGAVKITPGHDFNDFEVGKKQKLPMVSIFDAQARVNEEGGPYKGLDRFEARKRVLEDLKSRDLLEKEEPYQTAIGHCSRCDTIVEPRISPQWFVKTKPLAKPAIDAVRKKKVRIVPEGWTKTYFNWMENIKDWCISRQIWWGHRIPAWHCGDCGAVTVAVRDPSKCSKCQSRSIKQDNDVLDTWFSSALWPFSTLGWPKKTRDLKVFYPSTVMETGFDILFFWVARMMMMGIHFMKKPPFKYVYLHAMVRDPLGRKMSKSKGNVVDPLDIINQYGADALRFTLAILATPGRDVRLDDQRIEGYRNFLNKLWNAARFILMNLDPDFKPQKIVVKKLSKIDRWCLTRFYETAEEVNRFLEEYRLNEAANSLYQFSWHEFCDWYLELIKPALRDPSLKAQTEQVLVFIFRELMKLLHPFIPFVTEEIWQVFPKDEESVMIAHYPQFERKYVDRQSAREVRAIQEVVSYIRNVRGEHQIPPQRKFPVAVVAKNRKIFDLLSDNKTAVEKLGGISELILSSKGVPAEKMVTGQTSECEIFIRMTELFDPQEERKRLQKELSRVTGDLDGLARKLSNPSFVKNAPTDVVQGEKQRSEELERRLQKIKESLKRIEGHQ